MTRKFLLNFRGDVLVEFVGRMWECFSMVVVVVDEGEALGNSRLHRRRRVCMHVPTHQGWK